MIDNKTFFIKSLDDYSSKYLKTDPQQPINQSLAIIEHLYLMSKISEFFLFYDKISFKVYGENVPLILLIKWFGTDGVLKLIEQNALEFVLWTPLITYLDPAKDIEGVNPFQSGVLTSSVHCKPRISAQEGFNWLQGEDKPSKKVQKKIIRKVKKITIVPPKDLASDALSQLKFFHEKYNPQNQNLTLIERKKFASIADESIELSIASQHGYSFWNEENKWKLLNKKFDCYNEANIIHQKASKIFNIEKLPDISKLISLGKIPTSDIPELRIKNDAINFREWIRTTSKNTDTLSVSQDYLESLKPKYGFTGNNWFKNVRIASFSVLGGLIGAGVGDLSLGFYGALIGGVSTGIFTAIIDQYILEGLITGWKPQNFIEHSIRPYTNI